MQWMADNWWMFIVSWIVCVVMALGSLVMAHSNAKNQNDKWAFVFGVSYLLFLIGTGLSFIMFVISVVLAIIEFAKS